MTRKRLLRDSCRGLAAVLVLILLGATAHAETRVALVIGNGDYRNTSKLATARDDASDVAKALERLGFATIVAVDLDKEGMDEAEIHFARAARDAEVAMVYYSGHAIQYAGSNNLLPVDARITDAADLRRLEKLDDIVADLQQAKDLRILVLDCCRDNSLADALRRSLGERGALVQRGLARLGSPEGMIVAYATQVGQAADDGGGHNSPYTAALLKQIETPQEIGTIFRKVGQEVAETTGRRQIPELSLSSYKDFYLRAPDGPVQADAAPPLSGAGESKPPAPKADDAVTALTPPPQVQDPNSGKSPNGTVPDASPIGVAQRAVLYEENPAAPNGEQYVGSVVWRTEPVKGLYGKPDDVAVRADVDIPDRKFKMTMSFRRNTDALLPASHVAELTFVLPPGFAGGGVANVPGLLMKSNEQTRGVPLAGLAVKVTDGFFLVGLSNVDADRTRNLELLKERTWFDIPLVYGNKRRAILAIEKGYPGVLAYGQAFAAWGQ